MTKIHENLKIYNMLYSIIKENNYFCSSVLKQWKNKAN
ncbi:hypothetical protein HMPREF1077_02432 [Parabacteroides johnsonii CL02T12C29]|uniref:Uncharacterized protein n=1 Tax=Parabacteroides johnsonii CL02T12C29 TaxID=999419 RepID=K5ZDC0_9BACT|nr:hypothetical protein HMPREF1077_02432 [Parabacteroides johnsonii CL02T12C29]